MNGIENFVVRVAKHFGARLGVSLVEAYQLGSLAHGGFSNAYSDIDVGLLLNCAEPPHEMTAVIAEAKALDSDYGKKLSIFWGNPEFPWGRLPMIDRVDMLDHSVPLLHGVSANFHRPTKDEIHREQLQSIEKSWKPRLAELTRLIALRPEDRKPYIRAILYAARLIFTWDNLAVDSNDRAVHYLHTVRPHGLDIEPIDRALACRNERCTVEEVFALKTDLHRQYDSAVLYIGVK